MKANFIQRAMAYVIDFLVIMLILSLIYRVIPDTKEYKNANKRLTDISSEVLKGNVSASAYFEEVSKLTRTLDKERTIHKCIDIVITFSYFCVCAYYNNGQTLGKKVMRIKVRQTSGKLQFSSMAIRTILTQGILSGIILLSMVFVLDDNRYAYFSDGVYMITMGFVLICIVMILYTNNKRGLHDIITKTEVVKDRGD